MARTPLKTHAPHDQHTHKHDAAEKHAAPGDKAAEKAGGKKSGVGDKIKDALSPADPNGPAGSIAQTGKKAVGTAARSAIAGAKQLTSGALHQMDAHDVASIDSELVSGVSTAWKLGKSALGAASRSIGSLLRKLPGHGAHGFDAASAIKKTAGITAAVAVTDMALQSKFAHAPAGTAEAIIPAAEAPQPKKPLFGGLTAPDPNAPTDQRDALGRLANGLELAPGPSQPNRGREAGKELG